MFNLSTKTITIVISCVVAAIALVALVSYFVTSQVQNRNPQTNAYTQNGCTVNLPVFDCQHYRTTMPSNINYSGLPTALTIGHTYTFAVKELIKQQYTTNPTDTFGIEITYISQSPKGHTLNVNDPSITLLYLAQNRLNDGDLQQVVNNKGQFFNTSHTPWTGFMCSGSVLIQPNVTGKMFTYFCSFTPSKLGFYQIDADSINYYNSGNSVQNCTIGECGAIGGGFFKVVNPIVPTTPVPTTPTVPSTVTPTSTITPSITTTPTTTVTPTSGTLACNSFTVTQGSTTLTSNNVTLGTGGSAITITPGISTTGGTVSYAHALWVTSPSTPALTVASDNSSATWTPPSDTSGGTSYKVTLSGVSDSQNDILSSACTLTLTLQGVQGATITNTQLPNTAGGIPTQLTEIAGGILTLAGILLFVH